MLGELFDAHAHFYSDDIARFPLDAANKREGEAGLTARILAEPGTPERVFALWDANGVSGGAAVQYNNAYKTDNRYAVHVADQNRDRVGAVVILAATDPVTPARLAEIADGHAVMGLRLVGFSDDDGAFAFIDDPAAMDTWAAADRLGLALVAMFRLKPGESADRALAGIRAMAARFPQTNIVLDHAGWPNPALHDAPGGLTASHRALAEYANVTFKFTSLNFARFEAAGVDSADCLRQAADAFGADRLMWGSDFGNTLTDYAILTGKARASAAKLNAAEKRAYLHGTGERLFASR